MLFFLSCTQRWEQSRRSERGWLAGPGHTEFQPEGEEKEEERGREGKEDLRKSVTVTCFRQLCCQLIKFWFFFIALDFCSSTWILLSVSKYCCYHTIIVSVLFLFSAFVFSTFFFFLKVFYLFLGCKQELSHLIQIDLSFFPSCNTPSIRQLFFYSLEFLNYT